MVKIRHKHIHIHSHYPVRDWEALLLLIPPLIFAIMILIFVLIAQK